MMFKGILSKGIPFDGLFTAQNKKMRGGVPMKEKKYYSKNFIMPIIILAVIIASTVVMSFASVQTDTEAADQLQQLINEAWELLGNTHVAESAANVPVGEYGATQEAHTELINAITAAQRVLDLYHQNVDFRAVPMVSAGSVCLSI